MGVGVATVTGRHDPGDSPQGAASMSKSGLIDGIIRINPTARADWLERFDRKALDRYLEHLLHALEPRGRASFWVRDGETTAIVTRAAAA
jgi:hypothetical protein